MRIRFPRSFQVLATIFFASILSVTAFAQQPQPDEPGWAPAEPADEDETRALILSLDKLLPAFPDRGPDLYNLAAIHQHLGESLEAMKLLKECIALGEGFDPAGGPE